MAKKGFNLAELAKQSMGGTVSDSDTPQLRLIPFERIVPDPENKYSLDGIEELAGNIETVGLLDPLVVLPETEAGFRLLSGHRRREAIGRIIEGGSTQFEAGVPCIVRERLTKSDNPRVAELFDRLTLLMANSDNRKKTSADQNREAEEMEAVVAELAELGFSFPGRRRDWVAELSGMSRSKLARLKVIREKLEPSIRKRYYDNGKLSEDAAYKLAQFPAEHQKLVVDWFRIRNKDPRNWYASTIADYGNDLARLEKYKCPAKLGGKECINQEQLQAMVWTWGYRGYCYCAYDSQCCATCAAIATCRNVCVRMQEKAQAAKAEQRAAKKQAKEAEKAADAPKAEKVRNLWLRFGNALGRANMEDAELRKMVAGIRMYQVAEGDIALLEAGEFRKVKGSMVLPYWNNIYLHEAERLVHIADALGCSLDWLLCRTDVPEMAGRAAVSVSDSDTGIVWHETAKEAPPEDGSVLIFWGDKGLRTVTGVNVNGYISMWPEDYRWWAVVTGPEMNE